MSFRPFSYRPIGIDLFAGAGGMTLGFEQAGFEIVGAVEIDPIHCATHEYNFPDCSILCGDVLNLTGQGLRNRFGLGNQEIDVVFGGSPCQGFSVMGKRVLDDPRNSLLAHFARLIVELKPKYFVIENVKGLLLGKYQHYLQELIAILSTAGYCLRKPLQVLNAAGYGVPQNRERLFILGGKQGLALPKYPQEFASTPTVWDALQDLPEAEDYAELLHQDWVETSYGKPSEYGSYLRSFVKGQDDYTYGREWEGNLLTASRRTQHQPETIARFAVTPQGKIEPVSHFHKLHPRGIANTLRAGTPRSRGSYTAARPIHPFTPRCITVREAARLHSYPDWFRFHVTKWHGFRQVGNSVPPLLANAIASKIRQALGVTVPQPDIVYPLGNEGLLHLTMAEAAKYYGVDPYIVAPRRKTR
jgi:DNA (cytosine-5)-methyltransferase 1